MRIVIHTQYYPPEMGAPQARLSELAKRLVQHGHRVYVLTAMPNYPEGRIQAGYGGFVRREEKDGVSIVRTFVYPTKSIGMVRRLANYFSFAFSSLLIGAWVLPRVDFLMTESPPLFLGISGWILSKLKGALWILNLSDLWLESMRDFGIVHGRGLIYRMLHSLSVFLYGQAWLVTGQSEEIVAELRRNNPSRRVYHLSNGVDPASFHPKKRDNRVRQRYLKNGESGFIYAGLHGFFQGLDQVIRAADRLKEEPIRFLFFGDGSEKEAIMNLAGELGLTNVDFYPPLGRDQISSIMASMDVALIPLKRPIRGSVPSKIYEAMASSIPVLLMAGGEARQVVERSGAGMVIDPGDIEAITVAVRELASRPEWRGEMGRAGRQAAEQFYDRTRIVERFERVLLENTPG